MIEVCLFATFRENREKKYQFDDKEKFVYEYVDALNIDRGDVAIILINGFHQTLDSLVKDGDILSLFPATGGG
ncbi:MAG: MoaD/ThiS family protein [Anaerorhabdus sp.]